MLAHALPRVFPEGANHTPEWRTFRWRAPRTEGPFDDIAERPANATSYLDTDVDFVRPLCACVVQQF